nr:Bgl1C [uncultured bacterium]
MFEVSMKENVIPLIDSVEDNLQPFEKYKLDTINFIQDRLEKLSSYSSQKKSILDDKIYESIKEIKDLIYIDYIVYYFMQKYFTFKFFIDKDLNIIEDFKNIKKSIPDDYFHSVSNILDIHSEVLDDLDYRIGMEVAEEVNRRFDNDEVTDEYLNFLLEPHILEMADVTSYISEVVMVYLKASLALRDNKELLRKINSFKQDRNYNVVRNHISSILYNNNYFDNTQVNYLLDYNDNKWVSLKTIVRYANESFRDNLNILYRVEALYENLNIHNVSLNVNKDNNKPVVSYMGFNFTLYDVTEIMIFKHLLVLKEDILTYKDKFNSYFQDKFEMYADRMWEMNEEKNMFNTESELRLFITLFNISLSGKNSLMSIYNSERPRARNSSKYYLTIEQIGSDMSLNDVVKKVYQNAKRSSVENMYPGDELFLNKMIEKSINEIGTINTIKILKRSSFPLDIWSKYNELSTLEKLIPENNNLCKVKKF